MQRVWILVFVLFFISILMLVITMIMFGPSMIEKPAGSVPGDRRRNRRVEDGSCSYKVEKSPLPLQVPTTSDESEYELKGARVVWIRLSTNWLLLAFPWGKLLATITLLSTEARLSYSPKFLKKSRRESFGSTVMLFAVVLWARCLNCHPPVCQRAMTWRYNKKGCY